MHYYSFHINDFIAETHFLSNNETSIYLKLCNFYLHEEKPLKNNMNFLQRLSGGSEDEVKNILNLFFELKEEHWHRENLNLKVYEYQSQKEANSRGGKKSAINRKNKTNLNSTLSALQLTNNQEPLTMNQEQEINKKETQTKKQLMDELVDSESIFLEQFEEFWKVYPKQIGKEEALKEWIKQKPDLDKVKKALSWQRICKDWRNENGRFIPYPSKYLSQHRWDDTRPKEPWESAI